MAPVVDAVQVFLMGCCYLPDFLLLDVPKIVVDASYFVDQRDASFLSNRFKAMYNRRESGLTFREEKKKMGKEKRGRREDLIVCEYFDGLRELFYHEPLIHELEDGADAGLRNVADAFQQIIKIPSIFARNAPGICNHVLNQLMLGLV